MTDDKPVVGHYDYHEPDVPSGIPTLAEVEKMKAAYAKEVLAGHIAWMREHVRCETCQHFPGESRRNMDLCSRDIMCGGHDSESWGCTLWEPKP